MKYILSFENNKGESRELVYDKEGAFAEDATIELERQFRDIIKDYVELVPYIITKDLENGKQPMPIKKSKMRPKSLVITKDNSSTVEIIKLKDENKGLRDEIITYEDITNKLRLRVKEIEEALETASKAKSDVLSKTRIELSKTTVSLTQATQTIEKYQKENEELKERIRSNELSKVDNIKVEVLSKEVEGLKSELSDRDNEIINLNKDLDESNNYNIRYENTIKYLKDEVFELTKTKDKNYQTIDKQTKDLKEANELIDKQHDMIQKYESSVNTQQSLTPDYDSMLKANANTIDNLKKENENLKNELLNFKKGFKSISILKSENDRLYKQVDSLINIANSLAFIK